MPAQSARLLFLLRERHWQTYGTFVREYKKAAKDVDPELAKSPPSRAQFYRWISGEVKGQPYSDHCLVLEKMFPEWSAGQLLELCTDVAVASAREQPQGSGTASAAHLLSLIDEGLTNPGAVSPDWDALRQREAAGERPFVPAGFQADPEISGLAREIGQRFLVLAKERRLPSADTQQLARLAGNLVELDLKISINVDADGHSDISYCHELLNMGDRPLTKLAQELWFEHTTGPLAIDPISEAGHHVAIQRIHDTASLAKFACQVSPPIRPGEAGVVGYSCRGGRFVEDHYWRQEIRRYIRHLTIRLRHRGGRQLCVCTAVEGHPDGPENSATEDLLWDYEDDDVMIMLTRDYLKPGQSVTLRWAVSNEPA